MAVEILLAQSVDPELISACGEDPGGFCKAVYDWTGNENVTTFAIWVIEKPLRVALILFVAYLLKRLIHKAINKLVAELQEEREKNRVSLISKVSESAKGLTGKASKTATTKATVKSDTYRAQAERAAKRAETLGTVLRSMVTGIIYGLAGAIALGEIGVNLGPLIAGAGIAGVALGFGAQSLVKDFLTGIFMIIEDQYGVGDSVDLGDASGTVEEVSLRVTKVRDVHGTLWFVPNGEIRRVGNRSQMWARAVMDIEVAYSTDLELAARVIKEVADEVWKEQLESATIIEEPTISGVQSFGADAIAIRLMVKTDPGEQWATSREIRGRLKPAFDEHGIDIPFPQRTIWLKTEEDAPAVVPTKAVHAAGPGSGDHEDE